MTISRPDVHSLTSSLGSSHDFSVSRVLSNGNAGVISSVVWLTLAVGLCFPWLLEQPPATRSGDSPKSITWFLVLAIDLVIGTVSVFSLWFQRSTLSIILLVWGAFGIAGTFLVGSFAMLPAIATICCCAEELCVAGAADTSPLDSSFCLAPADLCMETRWTLWCFFGGILLAMISVVLLVNSVALHHKTLLDCERQRDEAAKAIRAANRARRRRQELWEQEVYGGGSYAGSNGTAARSSLRRGGATDDAASSTAPHTSAGPNYRGVGNTVVAPPFESPSRDTSRKPRRVATPMPASGAAATAAATTAATAADVEFGRVTPPASTEEMEISRLESPPTSTTASVRLPASARLSRGGGGGDKVGEHFAIGAYTEEAANGRSGGGGHCTLYDDAARISSWGRDDGPTNTGAVMSWVASEEDGGGQITPKTALRFKTSALARAMHR